MYEFHEHRCSDSLTLLGVKAKFVPVISQTIWAKFSAGDIHLILLSYDGFHKNRCSERRTLVSGVDKFLPAVSSLRSIYRSFAAGYS